MSTPSTVAPEIQKHLLDLAALDAELARLRHRRASLPETAAVEEHRVQVQARRDAAVAIELVMEDLDRDIAKLEGEVAAVRARIDKDNEILTAGTVGAKQLSEVQHELRGLSRRQGEFEDELIEVMERREATEADHEREGALVSADEAELAKLERIRDDALADIDSAEASKTQEREQVAAEFDPDLLALYEQRRAARGVGAALLRAGRCGGCRIELDRTEMSRIRAAAPEDLLRCPECGTILVRTNESGL